MNPLSWLRSGQKSVCVGLEFQADGMALSASRVDRERPQLLTAGFLSYEQGAPAAQLLKDWVSDQKMTNNDCHVVLNAEFYQLLLVEPPDVPADELNNAIRWRLKDLLSFPVDQAALQVFPLPADGTRANKKMVYVVASENQKIRTLVAMLRESGLRLRSIDIAELALRNLMLLVHEEGTSERGVVLIRLRPGGGSVYIYRMGNMYLTRSFALNYPGGLLDDLPDEALALEVQRSLDYYERQMGQTPPVALYVCGDHVSEDKIGAVLKASLSLPVKYFDAASLFDSGDATDESTLQKCVGALGGSLRREGGAYATD